MCIFLTFTVAKWLPLFENVRFKQIICDSLNFCVDQKGLIIYAYVIMVTHMHLFATSKQNNLSGFVRDFKKFTSKECTDLLGLDNDAKSKAYLKTFSDAANKHSRNKKYQVWQQNNHPEEIYSPKFTLQKIKYIHNNPVEAGIVNRPQDYYYSSAVDYSGGIGPVKVELLNLHNLYY